MTFLALLTFYCACFLCTGKHPDHPAYRITKSGWIAREGVTVACAPELAGHGLSIEGVGWRMCEDVGGMITTGRIDVFVNSHKRAVELGIRKAKVRVYPRSCI